MPSILPDPQILDTKQSDARRVQNDVQDDCSFVFSPGDGGWRTERTCTIRTGLSEFFVAMVLNQAQLYAMYGLGAEHIPFVPGQQGGSSIFCRNHKFPGATKVLDDISMPT